MADPERFEADPDPTFQADADCLARERKPFSKLHFVLLHILTKVVMCNFSVSIREEGLGVRDKVSGMKP